MFASTVNSSSLIKKEKMETCVIFENFLNIASNLMYNFANESLFLFDRFVNLKETFLCVLFFRLKFNKKSSIFLSFSLIKNN